MVLILAGLFSGSDDADVFSAYQGDRKLNEGDRVPFLLYQNHPNPFNPATSIRFDVAIRLYLKLTVYSEEWQPVSILYDRSADPGIYTVQFAGESDELPSGDYYYMLEGNGYRQIRKMKLVK